MSGRMFDVVAAQLMSAVVRGDVTPRVPFRPKPAGVPIPGSSSEAVLAFLAARPGRWFTRYQIIVGTGRPNSQVNYALHFLVAIGRVQAVPDASRNSRYQRYAAPANVPPDNGGTR